MEELKRFLNDYFIPNGIVDMFEFDTVDVTRKRIRAPEDYGAYYEITIENTGTENLYFSIGGTSKGKHLSQDPEPPYVKSGESFKISPKCKCFDNIELWAEYNKPTAARVIVLN